MFPVCTTKIRALETLGVITDKCAAMVFPLIESCLPEELIRVWTLDYSETAESGNSLKGAFEQSSEVHPKRDGE